MKGLNADTFKIPEGSVKKGNEEGNIESKKQTEIDKIVDLIDKNPGKSNDNDKELARIHRDEVNKRKKNNNEIIIPEGFPAKDGYVLVNRETEDSSNVAISKVLLNKFRYISLRSNVTIKDMVSNLMQNYADKFDEEFFK